MTEKKVRRTFLVPESIVNRMQAEGKRFGGKAGKPGLVASAALLMYFHASDEEKKQYVNKIRELEIGSTVEDDPLTSDLIEKTISPEPQPNRKKTIM